jgi:hypothetical protein
MLGKGSNEEREEEGRREGGREGRKREREGRELIVDILDF